MTASLPLWIVNSGSDRSSWDVQPTFPIMPNMLGTTTVQFERVKRGVKELGGGGASCRLKAVLTFADRNAETKGNIKTCHLISCGVSGDVSSTAKRLKQRG